MVFRTRSFVIKIILIVLNKLVGCTEEFQFISFWRSRDTVTKDILCLRAVFIKLFNFFNTACEIVN